MIRTHILISIIIAFSAQHIQAEMELTLDIGYGFGLGRTDHAVVLEAEGDTSDSLNNYQEYDDKYYSLGNGVKWNLGLGVYITENLAIAMQTGFTLLGVSSFESTYNSHAYENFIRNRMFSLSCGFKIKSSKKRILPYISLMPGLYLPFGVERVITDTEPNSSFREKDEWSYAPGFGFSGSLGIEIRMGDENFITIAVKPTYAFARLKEMKWEYTDHTTGITEKGTIKWLLDEPDLPEDTPSVEYKHGGVISSFSSCDFLIGLSYNF